MTVSRNPPAGVYSSWLSSLSLCCVPLTSCIPRKSGRSKSPSTTVISWPLGRASDEDLLIDQDDGEKPPHRITKDQPRSHPVIEASQVADTYPVRDQQDKVPRKSSASSRTTFSVRKRSQSTTTYRRPLISRPSNFRHVETGSFQFPIPPQDHNPQARPQPPRRRDSLERLELSIYMPSNQISPLLPHFEFPVPPPAAALMSSNWSYDDEEAHQRSYSAMSFHVPRKGVAEGSPSPRLEEIPPLIPPKAKARGRAYTSPDVDIMKERVATAMIEVERLQKQIDDVIERQSLYAPSRPSTSHSMANVVPGRCPGKCHLICHVKMLTSYQSPGAYAFHPRSPTCSPVLRRATQRRHHSAADGADSFSSPYP